ncbi:MAG: threonine/serine exporter family protein [Myxococcales bacterium]|nr:threonine/serine exporter family protein [Myxococcales bacterium]MCB9649743.1 threonine/serine exporter family protein [Deltaproteobacteria bacterium]
MAEPEDENQVITFVLELGQALQRYGAPAHRLEDAMAAASARLGLEGQFFTTPTAIIASFGRAPHQRTQLSRVVSGEIDLGKLAYLDRLVEDVVGGRLTVRRGRDALRRLVAAVRPWDRTLTVLAYGLVSGAAGRFFGGGPAEILVSGGIGLLAGLLAILLGRSTGGTRAFELAAAFLASTLSLQLARHGVGVAPDITTLAGLIVLVPGLTLTTALNELSTRNLVSGSARLTAAAIVFLQITFGVAVAIRLDAGLFGALPALSHATAMPGWTELAALAVAAASLVILFRAPPEQAPWIMAAAALSFGGARLGAQLLGPELGVAAGALAVGVAGNAYARLWHRPAVVIIVPGVLLLVPGSLGLRSLRLLLGNDPITGVSLGFSTLLVAVSVVAGLLLANLVVSPRRPL